MLVRAFQSTRNLLSDYIFYPDSILQGPCKKIFLSLQKILEKTKKLAHGQWTAGRHTEDMGFGKDIEFISPIHPKGHTLCDQNNRKTQHRTMQTLLGKLSLSSKLFRDANDANPTGKTFAFKRAFHRVANWLLVDKEADIVLKRSSRVPT